MGLKEALRERQRERLAQMKSELKLTQGQIAEVLQCSQQNVSALATGRSTLQPDQAELLEDAFGYRAQWLLGFDPLKTKADLTAAFDARFLENIVYDLAKRAGFEASLISWTAQDELTGRDLGTLARLNVTDPATGERASLTPAQVASVGDELVRFARYLLWDALRSQGEDDGIHMENLAAWMRGEENE